MKTTRYPHVRYEFETKDGSPFSTALRMVYYKKKDTGEMGSHEALVFGKKMRKPDADKQGRPNQVKMLDLQMPSHLVPYVRAALDFLETLMVEGERSLKRKAAEAYPEKPTIHKRAHTEKAKDALAAAAENTQVIVSKRKRIIIDEDEDDEEGEGNGDKGKAKRKPVIDDEEEGEKGDEDKENVPPPAQEV